MYVHDYMYVSTIFQPVASSVITATPMLMCSPVASQLYNITVTCTIHPDSTADQCVVMAMADGRVTRTGEINAYVCDCYVLVRTFISLCEYGGNISALFCAVMYLP